MKIDGNLVPFKLDTGAEVTVISEETLNSIGREELQSSNKRLCGPDNRSLEVVGEIFATISYKGRSDRNKLYVFKT